MSRAPSHGDRNPNTISQEGRWDSPKPWWRRWWAITLGVIVVLVLIGNLVGEQPTNTNDPGVPTESANPMCRQRAALGHDRFIDDLTDFRIEQQEKGNLPEDDALAAGQVLANAEGNFERDCPEFSLLNGD
jgi:hypothetical protein